MTFEREKGSRTISLSLYTHFKEPCLPTIEKTSYLLRLKCKNVIKLREYVPEKATTLCQQSVRKILTVCQP